MCKLIILEKLFPLSIFFQIGQVQDAFTENFLAVRAKYLINSVQTCLWQTISLRLEILAIEGDLFICVLRCIPVPPDADFTAQKCKSRKTVGILGQEEVVWVNTSS